MIHAYDEVYLEKASTALGRMLDFAVYDLQYAPDTFFSLFLSTGVAERFGDGEFRLLVGMSGVELAYEVLRLAGIAPRHIEPKFTANRSEEYWAGWALAHYQWESALSFSEIAEYIPITEIISLYSPYHEMDIRQFIDRMNTLYLERKQQTNLKLLRKNAETLKMSSIETAKQSERGIVDIETLKTTNESLISTLDEVMRIQQEGRQKRQEAEAEMSRMENELKAKLLQISG